MVIVKAFGKARIPGIKFGRKAGVSLASNEGGHHTPETVQAQPPAQTQAYTLREMKLDARPRLELRNLSLSSLEVDLINGFGPIPEWSRIPSLAGSGKGASSSK